MQTFPNLFHLSSLHSYIHACCMILFVTLLLRTTMYGAMWKGPEREIRLNQITSGAFLVSFRRFDGEFWSSWSPCKADVNYVRQKKMCWSKWQVYIQTWFRCSIPGWLHIDTLAPLAPLPPRLVFKPGADSVSVKIELIADGLRKLRLQSFQLFQLCKRAMCESKY